MRPQSKTELAGLVALAYGPFLVSSPGKVSADSKQYLYLDPGAFVSRAADLWDPQVGAGTVPHQNLGYLFPAGPWFWLLERLGAPDWVAQRLWLGTISLAAVLGARWLFTQLGTGRVGALAGALVYLLTPYQLAFTARMSVLLLPWAALPWMVGLTVRATRTGSWRPPALLAVVLLLTGGINASSLLLVAMGPVLWVLLELARGRDAARLALAGAARAALLGGALSLWWLVGLRLQGAYGLPVLQLTENVRTVAEASNPSDILRGLGNWFFYGRDRVGYSLDQAADYAGASRPVVVLSYAIPALALAVAFHLRWAHRAYFGLLVVVGTVIGVGAWPYDDPSPFGSLWKTFTTDTSFGLALRNSPRVVPVVVLGMAGLLAAAVGAVPAATWRRVAAGGVGVLALAGLAPAAEHGFLTDGMLRPEEIPTYWGDAASALDAGDHRTRILEVPGVSFAAYRWGTTVDPITPGLVDRPYLAREVLPQGTAGTANLLDALDRRMQQGTFEAAMLAPVARLFGVGTVALRADLEQAGRFDTPDPARLWAALRGAPGLSPPRSFGPSGGDGSDPTLPAVALLDVEDAQPIVRAVPVAGPVVLAGDGDGVVDAAAAGLIDGTGLLLSSAALDDAALDAAIDAGARLVLTDSNRRRIQTWFYSLRDTRGPTERAGETAPDPTGYDFRLDPFPRTGDAIRTVVQHVGGRVEATSGGGPERPEDRAAHAVDGDVATAWRVGGVDPRGQSLVIEPASPVSASEMRLVQPSTAPGGRELASVRVTVDDHAPVDVALGPESHAPAGQAVAVPEGTVGRVRIEVLQTVPPSPTPPGATPVGLAEVRIGDLRIAETVRPPIDLLRRVGERAAGLSLDVVLTRLRYDVPGTGRSDDEPVLDRTFSIPTGRAFTLTGLVRPHPRDTAVMGSSPGCRSDLLRVDGRPIAVEVASSAEGGQLRACEPLVLAAGDHRLTSERGAVAGLDVDRVVLSSDEDGEPTAVAPRDRPEPGGIPRVSVERSGSDSIHVTVRSGGAPFWLVLGQSSSSGWEAASDGASIGPRQLVNSYANGWRLSPDGEGVIDVQLRWTPQRLVWAGLAASSLALVVVLLILWRTRRRVPKSVPSPFAQPAFRHPDRTRVRSAVTAAVVPAAGGGLVALLFVPPEAAAAAVVVLVAGWIAPHGRWLLSAASVAALLLSRGADRPSLAWVAVVVLAADVLRDWVIGRRPSTDARPAAGT